MGYLTELEDLILENEAHGVMIDALVLGRDEWNKLFYETPQDPDIACRPIGRHKVDVFLKASEKSCFQFYVQQVDAITKRS